MQLENKLSSNLIKSVAPAAIKAGLPETSVPALILDIATGNAAAILQISGINPAILEATRPATLEAFTKSYQVIYLVSLAFGGCAIIASLCVDDQKLSEKMTTDIARKLQRAGRNQSVDER
jgi:type IV secretory pathway VirB2 component (pilin)